MKRNIVKIDEDKCNGCGLCAQACHEGAIAMVGGKAKLIRDDYCDGLGNCLPVCPTGAITIEEREAAEFDEAAVKAAQAKKQAASLRPGCPGTMAKAIHHAASTQPAEDPAPVQSELRQWPVQIKLVPVNAPYFDGAKLLIAADCTAFAYAHFHRRYMHNHITLIGCPKLDSGDYSEKLTAILKNNDIKSVKVVRMEVPCCQGIEHAVRQALANSGKQIPWQVVVVSIDGKIIDE